MPVSVDAIGKDCGTTTLTSSSRLVTSSAMSSRGRLRVVSPFHSFLSQMWNVKPTDYNSLFAKQMTLSRYTATDTLTFPKKTLYVFPTALCQLHQLIHSSKLSTSVGKVSSSSTMLSTSLAFATVDHTLTDNHLEFTRHACAISYDVADGKHDGKYDGEHDDKHGLERSDSSDAATAPLLFNNPYWKYFGPRFYYLMRNPYRKYIPKSKLTSSCNLLRRAANLKKPIKSELSQRPVRVLSVTALLSPL